MLSLTYTIIYDIKGLEPNLPCAQHVLCHLPGNNSQDLKTTNSIKAFSFIPNIQHDYASQNFI